MRPPFLLYCDDSGGEGDPLRSVAAVSGPARVLTALERDLRRVLALQGVDELKWAALRTRPARLRVARAFLELASVGLAVGALRVDALLWRPAEQGQAYRERDEPGRLRPVYHRLWLAAVRSWPTARWGVHPDQRTGMRWQRWPAAQRRLWAQGGGGLLRLREAVSARSACVQLCDLLAGLARLGAEAVAAGPGPGQRAWRNRADLIDHFNACLQQRGLRPCEGPGLLGSRHPLLNVRLLRRLPARS